MNQKTMTDFWKNKESKKEKWTITHEEVWLVENGEKIKLVGKNKNIYQELIDEGKPQEKE